MGYHGGAAHSFSSFADLVKKVGINPPRAEFSISSTRIQYFKKITARI
jgi:hypothetical protein